MGPVRAFAGDEGVHSLGGGDFHFGTGSASDDADAVALFGATGEDFGGGAGGFLEAGGEFGASDFQFTADAEVAAFLEKKWGGVFDSQRAGEKNVVAEPRMGIERKMG